MTDIFFVSPSFIHIHCLFHLDCQVEVVGTSLRVCEVIDVSLENQARKFIFQIFGSLGIPPGKTILSSLRTIFLRGYVKLRGCNLVKLCLRRIAFLILVECNII